MKKILTFMVTALMSMTVAFAQEPEKKEVEINAQPASVMSSTYGERFEFIAPLERGQNWAYRLDKYTGELWDLNVSFSHKYAVIRHETTPLDEIVEDRINYQILVRPNGYAYLLNLNTGIIWELDRPLFSKGAVFRLMVEQ